MPIPAEHVDVRRTTVANLDVADENSVSDIWDGTVATSRTLSDLPVGETRIVKLWRAPPDYDVVDGNPASEDVSAARRLASGMASHVEESSRKGSGRVGRSRRKDSARKVASRPDHGHPWDCSGPRRQRCPRERVRGGLDSGTCGLNRPAPSGSTKGARFFPRSPPRRNRENVRFPSTRCVCPWWPRVSASEMRCQLRKPMQHMTKSGSAYGQ